MDGQNFDPSFGKVQGLDPIKVEAPKLNVVQPKLEQPKFNVQEFEDEELNKAREEGSVQFASGVVRVSDAPTYNLPEVNKSLYGEKLGVSRADELRTAVGLGANESFTEYYKTNKFVPTGFDIDAKILLREEKVKKLETQVAQGKMGYQSFLFKAYGEDLLKADNHDLKSSLYWFNRRKQGMFDSPLDNVTYLTSLLQQAETLYRNELWYAESNTMTIQNSLLGQMGDKNNLPTDKIRDLFSEQFKQLDAMVESDDEKIKLYKAGLLRGFNPTIDTNGDGKVDWYLHRDGQLYKVREAGSTDPDTKAVSYYNADGSLDRVEVDGMFGPYVDSFVQGFGSAIAGIADLFIYGTVGIADTIENVFTGDWEYDKLADVYKEVEGFKGGTYLLGNNVYTTSNGWTNADGTIDADGIGRGVARGVGTLVGMLALSYVGAGLAGIGVKSSVVTDSLGNVVKNKTVKEILKTGGIKGVAQWGLRQSGNAINGVVGLSQGVYRAGASNAVLTATQATVRGLGFLAVKDFTTTVGSLTASKDLLGMDDGEIIGKSLTMTGLNFGLSFLLRSVGDSPATTRLANWWKANFQKTAEIKAAGALDDTFADALLRWAGDASKRKSFVFANSAMDVAENMLTMGTQTSLASTGKLFDKDAWAGLLDPQNIALQGWLVRNNVVGGLRGNDMQMGAAGVAGQLGNLNRIYNGDILGKMQRIALEKSASNNEVDLRTAETITTAVREANRIKDTEKNPAIGIQKAIMYLHNTFTEEGDMSFVREAIVQNYNKARTDEIVLGTKAAIETYTNVVAAKLNMEKDALLKGDIFGPGTYVSRELSDKKITDIQRIAEQFEGQLANMAKYNLVSEATAFKVLKTTNTKLMATNREAFLELSTKSNVNVKDLGDTIFEVVKVKQADGTEKEEFQIKNVLDGYDEKAKADLVQFINLVAKGNPNNLKGWTVVRMPNTGDGAEQSARLKVMGLFDTLTDIAKYDKAPDMLQPIYKAGEGLFVIPKISDGQGIQTLKSIHANLTSLYGIKYSAKVEDKVSSFKTLFNALEGRDYAPRADNNDYNAAVLTINKLMANGFITIDEAAGLLGSVDFSDIKTKADLKNLTYVNKALLYAKGVDLLTKLRTEQGRDAKTIDPSVVSKMSKEFVDYYTTELEAEPELQKLLAAKQGFDRKDLLNFLKENPFKDKDRLLSFFKALSSVGGRVEEGSLEDQFKNEILNELVELTGIKQIVKEALPDTVVATLRKDASDDTSNVSKILKVLIGGSKSIQDLRPTILGLSIEDVRKAITDSKSQFGEAWSDQDSLDLETAVYKVYLNAKAEAVKSLLFFDDENQFFAELIKNSGSIPFKTTKGKRIVQKEVKETVKVLKPFEVEKTEMVDKVETVQRTIAVPNFDKTPDNEQTYLRDEYKGKFNVVPINGKQFIQTGDNFLALVEFNGVRIPFYFSAGNNDKDGVAFSRWYAVAGVGKNWINKPQSRAIRNFLFSPAVRAMSEYLSDNISIPERFEFGIRPDAKDLAFFNEGLKPVDTEKSQGQEITFGILLNKVKQIEGEGYGQAKVVTETVTRQEPKVVKVTEQREVEETVTRLVDTEEEYDIPVVDGNELARINIDTLKLNENGERDTLYRALLSDDKIINNLFDGANETTHFKKAMELYEKIYLTDTFSRNTSGNITINVSELFGYYSQIYAQALGNIYKSQNILDASTVEAKLEQAFGKAFVESAKANLASEHHIKENLYHKFRDRIDNESGTIQIKFSVKDGRIVVNDKADEVLLKDIIRDLNHEVFELNENLDAIPGFYFKVQNADQAIDLVFEGEGKALFLQGLRDNGRVQWSDVEKAAIVRNIDFGEAIVEETGNLNYIDGNTRFNFDGGQLPRFYGSTGFEVSERIKSILDASPNFDLKQGRNGGALFKAYFLARVLPGVNAEVDVALKRNVFILDYIEVINKYQEEKSEGVSDKTLILTEMALTDDDILAFKNNGNLYDFTFVKDYGDNVRKVYSVSPKINFKELALDYIEKSTDGVDINYILPINVTDRALSNVALSNIDRLQGGSTTGFDLANYVQHFVRQAYSEEFITSVYANGKVVFNRNKVAYEKEIIKLLKNKTFDEIIKAGNTEVLGLDGKQLGFKLNETIHYEMLTRFLNGSKVLSDYLVEQMTSREGDKANVNLNIVLSDSDVRVALAQELQKILTGTYPKDNKPGKPLLNKDDERILNVVNVVNRIIDKGLKSKGFKSVAGNQVLMRGSEPGGKTSIDSYSISALGIENDIGNTRITKEDVYEIYRSITQDQEFIGLASGNQIASTNPVVSKIKSIISSAENKGENRVSIFIDDIYRLNKDEFQEVFSYLKGTKLISEKSLNTLQSKYNLIQENSSFYEGLFNNKLDTDFVVQERLVSVAGIPSVSRDYSVSYYNGRSRKNINALNERLRKQPVSTTGLNSKAIKASSVGLNTRNPYWNLLSNLKNSIEKDIESPLTGSRLIQNLEHHEFMGRLIFNVGLLGQNVQKSLEAQGIKIGVKDATKIAMTIFNQSTGVTYDKFYSNFFFYDTKENTVKAVVGSGSSQKGFGYIASNYIADVINKEPGRMIAFQVDKDALLSSSIEGVSSVKFSILNKENKDSFNELVNNFVLREYTKNPSKDLPINANIKDQFVEVLSRYTNQSDTYDMIEAAIVKLKIPQQYARSIAKSMFYNGLNVAVGSPFMSFNENRTLNTLMLNDPNYRTDTSKENNLQRSINNAVYMINTNELPSDYVREVNQMASDFELLLSKADNYRDSVVKVVRSILSQGTKGKNTLLLMEAFSKSNTPEKTKEFLQDVTALYILKKNDGATHNFILLDNNVSDIVTRQTMANKVDVVFQDSSKADARTLLNKPFFIGDVENAWYKDSEGNEVPLILELSLLKHKGIEDINKFVDDKTPFVGETKKIVVPAFYGSEVLTKDLLIKLTKDLPEGSTIDQRIAKLLPEYYARHYSKHNVSSKLVWENYFNRISSLKLKTKDDVAIYIKNELNKFGYTGNEVLLSFNGKAHDFGTVDKDSVFVKAGILNKNDSYFQNKHVDILTDLYTSNRFEVDSYADQQGMALIDLASKFGFTEYNETIAHDSAKDVEVTGKIATKIISQLANSNKITSNILNVFEDLRTNLGLTENDVNVKTQVEKAQKLNSDFLTGDTKEFINNYKFAFNEENLQNYNKAINTMFNGLKEYLDVIEKEVKRKQIYDLVRNEVGSRYDFLNNVQKNHKELGAVIEYLISKQERFERETLRFDKESLVSKNADNKGQAAANKSGLLQLFDLFREAFGDEFISEEGEVSTYKSISAMVYEKLLSLDPKEIIDRVASARSMAKGYQISRGIISYDDFLKNKERYDGSSIRSFVSQLEQDGTLSKINAEEESNRLLNKFANVNNSLFGDLLEGFDKTIQDIIINEAATPLLKNLALSEKQYKDRINNRGLKLNDSKFMGSLKKYLAESSFGSTFHYSGFYKQVNQADNRQKYKLEDGKYDYVLANEVAMTKERYEEVTGISYENAKALFGNTVYLNVMRHPLDKVGSISSLKVKILDDVSENSRFSVLMNTDTLYAVMAGDVDGDYVSIIAPTKGMVEFNKRLYQYNRKGNALVSRAIASLDQPKLVNNSDELKAYLKFSETFAERALKDRTNLLEGNVDFKTIKEQRLAELEGLVKDKALAEKLIDKLWLKEYNLSEFLVNVNKKIYYSTNSSSVINDDINAKAFKELSFAKTINFGAQAITDSSAGFFTNLTNRVGEKFERTDAKFLLNYAAFGLTEATQEFINLNLPEVKAALIKQIEISKANNELPVSEQEYKFMINYINDSKSAIDIASVMNKLDSVIFSSKEFGNTYVEAYKEFQKIDQDDLNSKSNYNYNLLKDYAKGLGIEIDNSFDLMKLKEVLFEKLADYSKGNFWASSGSSRARKDDILRGLAIIEDQYGKRTDNNKDPRIKYHQSVARVGDEDGFQPDVHANVVVVLNKNKFSDEFPLNFNDVFMVSKDAAENLKSVKGYVYKLNALSNSQANVLIDYQNSQKVLKKDIELSTGQVISKGSKIIAVIKEKNGSFKVIVNYATGLQEGTKLVVPGAKAFKSTMGGQLKEDGTLAKTLKANNVNHDFIFGPESIDPKNVSPFVYDLFNKKNTVLYKYNEETGASEVTDKVSEADYAVYQEIPFQLSQIFFDTMRKDNTVDDITLSTSKRNIFGQVLFGDSFITIDKDDPTKITYNSEHVAKGAKALDIMNQPTLIANNAAFLHGNLLNTIALKYSGLSKKQASDLMLEYNQKFDMGSVNSLRNFWFLIDKYFDKDINNLMKKVSDVEKVILSNNLYENFFELNNGKLITDANDLDQKSKGKGFERSIKESDLTLRGFSPDGEYGRYLAKQLDNSIFNDKYKGALVFDNTFGYMSMVEYLNFIINTTNQANINKSGYKPIALVTSRDLTEGSILNILNVGNGISSSLFEGFKTVNLRDSLIEQSPQKFGSTNVNQKTGTELVGTTYETRTGKYSPSPFSESKKSNDFNSLLLKGFTETLSGANRSFDDVQKKYIFDKTRNQSNINLNTKDSTSQTNLKHSEVRFLKYILGSVGEAKDIFERASLFGYNKNVFAPISVTGININSNDNRVSFGYDNKFLNTSVKTMNQDIRNELNSRRFLDLFEFKKGNLKDSITEYSKNPYQEDFFYKSTNDDIQKRYDEAGEYLIKDENFKDTTEAQTIWNNLFKETVALDNAEMKFKQKLLVEGNQEILSKVFTEDLLSSGLFKILNEGSGLTIEVERMVKDYLIEPKIFLEGFTKPLKGLHQFVTSLGVLDKFNAYAASKYYVFSIQKIDEKLNNNKVSDTDKQSLRILKDQYVSDFNNLKTGFNTPNEFMASFENLYGNVVSEFNRVNSYLGVQFKTFSVMTDEASDNIFYLLKPSMRKGFEKEEKVLQRLSMFTYNDEKEYDGIDLSSFNYFDDVHTKLTMLSKQAATVRLSNNLKKMGLLANVPVKDFLAKSLSSLLEEPSKTFVAKGPRGQELKLDVLDFNGDVTRTLSKYNISSGIDKDALNVLVDNGKIGDALYYIYNTLETTLSKQSGGLSREQAMANYRLAKPETPESNKAIGIMNMYELQNQALIMLTNGLDKDVLNTLYTTLKAEANSKGYTLTDKFGRIIHEDPRDYKLLFNGSTESVKHLIKYSSYGGGFEKNIILDALNGDVFFGNKSLTEALDQNFFTTKMPNKVIQTIAKLNGLVSKLIMSNPFRYIDRLIGFTAYDVATLGSFEPKTFLKLGNAMNHVSAFLQSKYTVINPELKEFFAESGINIESTDLSELFSGFSGDNFLDKIINPVTDTLGKGFNIQNIIGRYSYWLAVKENLDTNKPVNYGPSLNIKNAVDALTDKVDEDNKTIVSANGRKAYFLMSNILGAPGDFPILARKLKGLAMFTTFPLAAARFTRGLLGSSSHAIKEMLIGDNKQVALRWLTSTGLGMAGLYAVPWLIFQLWGNLMGLSEEEKEEWKEQADGMPEFVRSIFTGSPVINKFNTFNQYALLESMTIQPFREALDEGGTIVDGAGRWLLDNVASRGPAPLKLTAEVLGGFDSFGGTIQDTSDQWSMWENFQRKVGGYVIGGSGANALTTYLNKDLKYTNQNFVDAFVNGFRVVIEAEMGNTSAFKTDVKNYYRANNIIQTARFANPQDTYYTNNNFDTETYGDLKSELGRALRRKAKPSVVYGIIKDAMESGVGLPEVRSALRNNSLEYKLSQVPNISEFYANLSESEFKTINDAIAYERQTYPFLDDLVMEVNSLYNRNYQSSRYTPRVYIPKVYSNRNYRTNYSYNYENFVRNSRYNNLFKIYDPYKSFRASWFKLNNLDRPREE